MHRTPPLLITGLVGILFLSLPPGASAHHLTFAVRADRFSIDGNAFGPLDGTDDFVDEFDDGVIGPGFTISSGTAFEADGFAHLVSPGAPVTTAFGVPEVSSIDSVATVIDGAGNFRVTVRYAEPTLDEGELLGYQLIRGPSALSGGIANIGGHFFFQIQEPPDLETAPFAPGAITGDVIVRFTFDDAPNLVTMEFSLDGGNTFQSPFAPRPVFTTTTDAFFRVFGAAFDVPDTDGDGIPDDGDLSGTPGDLPCTGGNTAFCDDNCRSNENPSQADSDSDGIGDACDLNCTATSGAMITGVVYDSVASPANALPGAIVDACTSTCCSTVSTDSTGTYVFEGLAPGSYTLTAWPPASHVLVPGRVGPVVVAASELLAGVDIILTLLILPGEVLIDCGGSPARIGPGGVPFVRVDCPLTLTTSGCAGATATYKIADAPGGTVFESGLMIEGTPGVYSVTIGPPWPPQGRYVSILLLCPDSSTEGSDFNVWIDPSGTVTFVNGVAVPGATVTLLRSDIPSGPFDIVPFGSAIMSPQNRENPDLTDSEGRYGWDVVAGFYRVRARFGDCTVTSDVLTIPPAVTDLELRLGCLCGAGPLAGCLQSERALLLLKDPSEPKRRKVLWKWLKGEAMSMPDLGDPVNRDAYSLCAYDGVGELVLQADAPAGGVCPNDDCWSKRSRGFVYKDNEKTPNGLARIVLKAGDDGKAKILMEGGGINSRLPDLGGLALPLRVQLQRGGTEPGQCWETTFTPLDVVRQSTTGFAAKTTRRRARR